MFGAMKCLFCPKYCKTVNNLTEKGIKFYEKVTDLRL